jgi:SseB protein N-terminal domain
MTGAHPNAAGPGAGRDSGHLADSAGTPWSGRLLTSTGFEGDSGAADPQLLQALANREARPGPEADARLVEVAGSARWLVPVVAVLGEVELDPHGHAADKRTDMAVVTLTAPDGRRALPVFTSVDTLTGWQPRARPVPVDGARAAQAAIAEGCQIVVVDISSNHVQELQSSLVWAMARRERWQPAHTDPVVAHAMTAAAGSEPDVQAYRLEDGDPTGRGVLRVVLVLRPGLTGEGVSALLARVGEQLANDREFRMRVDELTFALEAATDAV